MCKFYSINLFSLLNVRSVASAHALFHDQSNIQVSMYGRNIYWKIFFFFRIIGICYASHGEKHVFKFCFKQKLGYSRSPPTTGFDRKTVTFNAKCFAQRTIYVHFFFFQNERTCVFPFAVHRIQTKDCSSESLEDFGHFIQDTTGMRYASNYLTLRCSFRIKGHDVNC